MANAVGESVVKGTRWGLAGGILGSLAAVGLVGGAGYGLYSLGAAWMAGTIGTGAILGFGALGVAGIVATAAIATPIVLTLGGAGAFLGVLSGAKHASRENAQHQAASNYQAGYDQTVSNIQAQLAQAAQAQQQPAYNSGVQMTENSGVRMTSDMPTMQAANTQVDAATIDHQQQVEASAEVARG